MEHLILVSYFIHGVSIAKIAKTLVITEYYVKLIIETHLKPSKTQPLEFITLPSKMNES